MGEIILILTKIVLLIAAVICFMKPSQVVKAVYGISRKVVDKLGLEGFVDPKTKDVAQSSTDRFESLDDEFPWHVRSIRLSGVILFVMFVLSLCMVPPQK